MNWQTLKLLAIQKLAERSTWLGLIALSGLLGYTIEPEWATWIVTTGVALGSMILIATNDVKNTNATITVKVNSVPMGLVKESTTVENVMTIDPALLKLSADPAALIRRETARFAEAAIENGALR